MEWCSEKAGVTNPIEAKFVTLKEIHQNVNDLAGVREFVAGRDAAKYQLPWVPVHCAGFIDNAEQKKDDPTKGVILG